MIPATPGTASRLRPDLAVLVHETMSDAPANGFIASQVAPYYPVGSQSADFPVLPMKALFANEKVDRAPGAAYQRSGGKFEAGHYSARERGHEHPLDDRFRAMYTSVFDMEAAGIDICTMIIKRQFEKDVATKVQTSGNFYSGAASVKWNIPATADPKTDVATGRETMRKRGVMPNTLIISWPTFENLKKCAKVIDAVNTIFPDTKKTGTIGLNHLEAYLEIRILVGGAMIDSANRAKSANLTDIWSDTVATLAYVAPAGSEIYEPSIARTFLWNEGSDQEFIVEDYREEGTRSDILRVRHDIDVRLLKSYDDNGDVLSNISKNCGYVITGIK